MVILHFTLMLKDVYAKPICNMSQQVEKKAGYKSTEFWMSLAAVAVGAIASTGMVEDNEFAAKIVGLITATLVALGFTHTISPGPTQTRSCLAVLFRHTYTTSPSFKDSTGDIRDRA